MAIVDECHIERAIVQQWLEMSLCTCGLTATPLARWMPEKWKQLISPVTTREAIDDAWLLEPTFRAEIVDVEKDTSEYLGTPAGPGGIGATIRPRRSWSRTWTRLSPRGGAWSPCRPPRVGLTATHRKPSSRRPPSITPRRWPHGLRAGVKKWKVVSYRQTQVESEAIVASFRRGKVRGLVSVAKLTVGFDAPAAACLVSARPTRRLLPWVQLIGRIMRTGSKTATVVDCTGNAARFAARLHRFWAHGAVWPLPESIHASPSPPAPDEGVPRYPCPDHPEIVHPPNAQVCKVCFRPLQEIEPPETAKVWTDGVTAAELGRSVRLLASQRIGMRRQWVPDTSNPDVVTRTQVSHMWHR